MCRSVRHTAQARTRSSTSPAPGVGVVARHRRQRRARRRAGSSRACSLRRIRSAPSADQRVDCRRRSTRMRDGAVLTLSQCAGARTGEHGVEPLTENECHEPIPPLAAPPTTRRARSAVENVDRSHHARHLAGRGVGRAARLVDASGGVAGQAARAGRERCAEDAAVVAVPAGVGDRRVLRPASSRRRKTNASSRPQWQHAALSRAVARVSCCGSSGGTRPRTGVRGVAQARRGGGVVRAAPGRWT